MASFVFTVLGRDRAGLVDEVAAVVADHGGNWERSHMARLGGRFAGIVEVGIADERAAALRAALAGVAGLEVVVDDLDGEPSLAGTRIELSLVGTDRPGLVRAITTALVEVGANIEELSSSTTSAPMSGEALFEATVVAALPSSLDVTAVRDRLESLADRLMVDIAVTT